MVIQVDSREKGNKEILEYFNENGYKFIISKMYAGDYQNVDSVKTLIDKKDSLVELAGNLCRASEHERIKKEIIRACDIGCERFIFLIAENKIKSVEEVDRWEIPTKKNGSKYTNVRPEVLKKIMQTMEERYGVEFMFVPKSKMGAMIVDLLGGI